MKTCKFCGAEVENTKRKCPNCGSAELVHVSDTPVEQAIIHKHVYVNQPTTQSSGKAATIQKKKKKHWLLWTIAIIIIVAIANSNSRNNTISSKPISTKSTIKTDSSSSMSGNDKYSTKQNTEDTVSSKAVNVESGTSLSASAVSSTNTSSSIKESDSSTIAVDQTNKESDTDSPIVYSFYDASDMKGRGIIDYPGLEPNYVNAIGYVSVYIEADLEENADFSHTPWIIPIYRKTNNGWEKYGTIEHKTKIGIIAQELKKQNGREYEGYLEFQELTSGQIAYINVKNFVTTPYWELDVSKAVTSGYGLATFKQTSKYLPVYKNGRKADIKSATPILLPAKGTYYISIPDRINYQILGIIFEKKNNKIEAQFVFFNKDDLILLY